MKKNYILLVALIVTTLSYGQTTLFQESFETGNSATASETCNDNWYDFFTVTDGTDIGENYEVSGQDGTFFFAVQDTDGDPCTLADETLEFTGIDISNYNNLNLALLVAEDDSSDGEEDWDDDTSMSIQINIDGAGYQTILAFEATELRPDGSASTSNKEPKQDTNLDGTGDGTALSPTFQEFTASIAGTGSTADIKIIFTKLNAGDEDISIDNIRLTGDAVASIAKNDIQGFTMYPNPTNSDVLYIKTTKNLEKNIRIFDVLGKQVLFSTTSETSINISGLNTGMYFVKVQEAGNTVTRKLVIK